MRKPIIAGNWKMYNNIEESEKLVVELKALVKDVENVDIIIAPPFTALSQMSSLLIGTNIKLAAQNMYFEQKGAFTGEISPEMLTDIDCEYVIIGHSERRSYFNETNHLIQKKITAALKNKLIPILCIGESLAQREEGKTFEVIETQLKECLPKVDDSTAKGLIIAYEPIWAIGTGVTATKEQAQEVHAFCRKELTALFDKNVADSIRILYGGSVKPDNIDALMSQEDIDGALVGGAALNAESFARIVKFK